MGDWLVYLLRDIEKHLKKKEIAAARFGRDAVGDPRFVFDLRRGREPRQRTVDRVRNYLDSRP
ncbi:hypothetical protein NDO55_01415 [Sphingomicrobium sp. GRR-S6-50]|uniref:Uncharacterized protein n=1 Tax=Sphingomicrobium sediminis TaxID=2950949 RepID=A0A9X2EF99_9SPHN|nr:hypothetical protein [Sphingomicrobium sediminis]MCM8556477.1 hypothetical protein [Sphingomicrobium sediminis]